MTSFASLADIRALLGRDFADGEPASAQLALDLATAAIQSYTRQTLTLVTDDAIALYGNRSRKLALPERPVASVSAVLLNSVPLAASSYMLVRDELWWGAAPLNVANITEDLGLGWGTTATPIHVTYTHGFAAIPADLRAVCAYVAFQAFQMPIPITAESVGGYSVAYGKIAEGALELTSFQQQMLSKYRRTWL